MNDQRWRYHRHWGRYPARYWWRPVAWAGVAGWISWLSTPAYYNYGSDIYYQDNSVYYGDEQVATAEQYYDQADTIAESAPQEVTENTDWLPLGVFAVTQDDSGASDMMLQLAVSKEGVIAGTLYNETTNATTPVDGMVDKKSQRAAWKRTDDVDSNVVMETGVYNLTKQEVPVLVHFGPDETRQWLLVRLEDSESKDTGAQGS